ncbi:hypothetical protein D9756_005792 [Leucocoprinus leucothites]|uniref:Uncharacterized protein n=1 Tax=Leucocoprinus leucothites TaxID=201217 RepID=A0A8H5D977_9AGAR|nr:hypothetical protein D9756_005792 [Leucoagaricus leucothites]
MSFFAGGGWRNATSAVAQATTTTNTVSASRQASVDESVPVSSVSERRPLLRAQTDPLVKLSGQNGSQASLASSSDPNVGARRFTLRGVARALYFMGPSTPAATAVPEEVESPAPSSPPQPTSDLPTKIPVNRSALAQEVIPPAENTSDLSRSPVSDGSGESVESSDGRAAGGRCVLCSLSDDILTAGLVLYQKINVIVYRINDCDRGAAVCLSGLEDVLSEVKKQGGLEVEYSRLQSRIQVLERENDEKSSRLQSVEEAAAKEKAEFRRVHAAEMESQRREHQDVLEALRRQSKEAEEKASSFERELEALRGKVTIRDEVLREMQVQIRDLSSAKAGLQDTIQELKGGLEEKEGVIGELQTRSASLETEKTSLERQRDEVQAEFSRDKEVSEMALTKLATDHAQKMSNAANTISSLQKELSNSSATVEQLRASLDTATRTADGLSQVVEERTADIHRLQKLASDLQGSNYALEQKVHDVTSQMKLTEETAVKERMELGKKYASDLDAERRIIRNLQSSLESVKLEMGVTEGKVNSLTREKSGLLDKVGKLEERCRSGEQQIEGLKVELARANSLARDLEEKGKVSREEARKEKASLTGQLNVLRRQLDDSQKLSAERQDRIQRLEATTSELTNELRRAQTSANEKDTTIRELQRENATLEETRDNLEGRLLDMERILAETKETAQSVLNRTNEAHDHEMAQARTRVQELQDELSSFITTAQQLHASLEISQSENAKARKTIEERVEEITRLQQHASDLQGVIRSLEARNEETISQMQSREQAAREAKANLLRSHDAEMQTQRTTTQKLKESLEWTLKEKEERLAAMTGKNGTLRAETSTMQERIQKNEAEITAMHTTLRDVTERNKVSIERLEEERAKLEDEGHRLRRQADELQRELRERGEELEKLKATPFQKMGAAMSNALGGIWFFLGTSKEAAKGPGQNLSPTQ